MSEPLVSRSFHVGAKEVRCSFFRPQPDQGEYVCAYTIEFTDRHRSSRAYGVDGIQALLLAMQKAHVDLLVSEDFRENGLNFLGTRDLDLPLANSVARGDFDSWTADGAQRSIADSAINPRPDPSR